MHKWHTLKPINQYFSVPQLHLFKGEGGPMNQYFSVPQVTFKGRRPDSSSHFGTLEG